MLQPSPTQATTLPSSEPIASSTVSRSARSWQGWSRSVRPLMTGTARVGRQLLDIGVGEGPDHQPVDEAGEDAGHVLERLAAAELDVAGREEDGVSAKLAGADLEGDAGAGGALGEDQADVLVGERPVPVFPALHRMRGVEQRPQLGARDVGKGEEVTGRHGPLTGQRSARMAEWILPPGVGVGEAGGGLGKSRHPEGAKRLRSLP